MELSRQKRWALQGLLASLVMPGAALAQDSGATSTQAAPEAAGAAAAWHGPIVVTGSTSPLALEQLGPSLTVIDRADIERAQVASLADLLRQVPGVAVNRSGSFGAPVQVRIRGGEGNHTLVLIDGVEVAAIGEGEFDFASLLAGNIERVEVLRGPQSGLYGSNALAGVVSVITRGGEGPPLEAALEAGSFGSVMTTGSTRIGGGETFLAASGQFRSTDGISTAAIGSEADGERNATGYLRGGWQAAPGLRLDGSLRLADRHTETDGFDFSGGPNQGLAVDDPGYADSREFSGGLTLAAEPAAGWAARASLAYAEQALTGGADDAAIFGNEGQRLRLAGQATRSFVTGSAIAHTLTLFADYERETYRNSVPADTSQAARQRRTITGAGAQYRLALAERVFLSGTLRRDDNSHFADATTWSLAVAWLAGPSTRLHASWGKGVTNPTFYEQFGFDPGSFVGNPALVPESARAVDLGIEQRLGERVLLGLTWFRSTLRDEIVSSFPSVVNDTGRSRREGVEATLAAKLGAFRLTGSYTRLAARDPDGTREVRRPRDQASLDISGAFGAELKGVPRGSVDLAVVYNGQMLDEDFRDYFTDGFVSRKSPLDAYWLVRLAASWRATRAITLFGRVENLLDDRYQEVLSYGAPGLAAYGGLTWRPQ